MAFSYSKKIGLGAVLTSLAGYAAVVAVGAWYLHGRMDQRDLILLGSLSITAGLIFTLVYSAWMQWFASRWIARPLKSLREQVQKADPQAIHDLKAAPKDSIDEIEALADALEVFFHNGAVPVSQSAKPATGSQALPDSHIKNLIIPTHQGDAFVLFLRIYGLDKIVVSSDPHKLVTAINDFHADAAELIQEAHGVVSRMHGGAILAVWGVPETTPFDGDRCLRTALALRKTVDRFNDSLRVFTQHRIRHAMAVHYGPVVSGKVGHPLTPEPSVIGEAIDATERIQAFAESFNTDLILTGAAASYAPEDLTTVLLAVGDDDTPELYEVFDQNTDQKAG